jgi:protein O-mannosyl-transferase
MVHGDKRMKIPVWAAIPLCAAAVFAAMSGVLGNGFTNYDDDVYITGNSVVRSGLTINGCVWAFTTGTGANWHPLAWLSHMADVTIAGLNPAAHHGISLLLHFINSLLIFLLFRRMTGDNLRSLGLALCFAVHPVHVESVAWAAERKDVLSASFGLCSLLAYTAYVKDRSAWNCTAVAAFLMMSLLTKPMLVTLPILFLILDYWPLRQTETVPVSRLIREKFLFAGFAAASGIVTLIVQGRGGAMEYAAAIPSSQRIGNAIIGYLRYIGITLWPDSLSVFYPYPKNAWPFWLAAAAATVLALVTFIVFRLRRINPSLVTGWLWFLASLVPVIGIIPLGWQSMADRYMYLPVVGLLVMVFWGIPDRLLIKKPVRNIGIAVASVLFLCLVLQARRQVGTWKDSETLFRHAALTTENNWIAYTNLGVVMQEQGDLSQAIALYQRAISLQPPDVVANKNIGMVFAATGQYDSARVHYELAAAVNPHYPMLQYDYAYLLMKAGMREDAIRHFYNAAADNPGDLRPRFLLGRLLVSAGRYREAQEQFNDVLRIDSRFMPAMAERDSIRKHLE